MRQPNNARCCKRYIDARELANVAPIVEIMTFEPEVFSSFGLPETL